MYSSSLFSRCFSIVLNNYVLQVECKVATESARSVLAKLRIHISSWFDYVESKEEYDMSYSLYVDKVKNAKDILGEHACMAIEAIVINITSKHEYLFHYNFIGRCTFGFKGDSICESSFSSLKSEANKSGINSRRTIDMSTMAMIDGTVDNARRKNISMSNEIEREVCWSKATVSNDLTKYALGIFNDNVDRRLEYLLYRTGRKEWMVAHVKFGKDKVGHVPRFDRVRKVCISEEGFMNCSCGKTGKHVNLYY